MEAEVDEETCSGPQPLIRQAAVVHSNPWTGQRCPKQAVEETFTYDSSQEIVRVTTTCSRCRWVGLRVVPDDDESVDS